MGDKVSQIDKIWNNTDPQTLRNLLMQNIQSSLGLAGERDCEIGKLFGNVPTNKLVGVLLALEISGSLFRQPPTPGSASTPSTSEGLALNKAFMSIPDHEVREGLIYLMESIADIFARRLGSQHA